MGKFDIKSLHSIEAALRRTQNISRLAILIAFLFCIAVVFLSYNIVESSRNKVYVLNSKGAAMEFAIRNDVKDNRYAEVKHNMKMLHEAFYTLTPDKEQIKNNQSIALNLGDGSLIKLRDIYLEQGYFSDIQKQKIFSSVRIDSIHANTRTYPYEAVFYGKNILTRPSSELVKSLVTRCKMRDVSRSVKNPHGLLIEKFEVLENKVIDEYKR